MTTSDPVSAWQRYKTGNGPLHDLTVTIARAIHKERYCDDWDRAVTRDQWLAVASWQTAEAVVQAIPLAVWTPKSTVSET